LDNLKELDEIGQEKFIKALDLILDLAYGNMITDKLLADNPSLKEVMEEQEKAVEIVELFKVVLEES